MLELVKRIFLFGKRRGLWGGGEMEEWNPVFITTCSMNKAGGGHRYGDRPEESRPSSEMVSARSVLYEQIKQLAKPEPERRLRQAKRGPDISHGQPESGGSYLPAYERYARGSFMAALADSLEQQGNTLDAWLKPGRLFFVSGLYGLVDAFEPIQNYDVEMSWPAADHWFKHRSVLAQELGKQLPEKPIVLNCCSDSRYSDLIDWGFFGDQDIPLFHAVDPLDSMREGSQIRAEAGRFAATFGVPTVRALMDGQGVPGKGTNADLHFRQYGPDMNSSDKEIVFSGLDLLPTALIPFVEKALRERFPEGWNKKALGVKPDSAGNLPWDQPSLLYTIDARWEEAFNGKNRWQTSYPLEIWGIVKEMRAVRHRLCHHAFGESHAERALDSMCRLAEAVGNADIANQLKRKRDFIRRKRRG